MSLSASFDLHHDKFSEWILNHCITNSSHGKQYYTLSATAERVKCYWRGEKNPIKTTYSTASILVLGRDRIRTITEPG